MRGTLATSSMSSKPPAGQCRCGLPGLVHGRPWKTQADSETRWVCSLPQGTPQVFLETVEDPLGDVVGRYARTHGTLSRQMQSAEHFGLPIGVVTTALTVLESGGSAWYRVRSVPADMVKSGWTPRYSDASNGAALPPCARRSKPSSRVLSGVSFRRGQGVGRTDPP